MTVSYLLFDRGSSEAAVLVEISRDFSSFSMVHFFTDPHEIEQNQSILSTQCANQESNKVERYNKTNCAG